MAELVELNVEDDRWSSVELDVLANRAAGLALGVAGLTLDGYEISLLACNDVKISQLNQEYRGKPVPTNVLSWPAFRLGAVIDGERPALAPEPEKYWAESLGDLAISFDTCQREATGAGVALADHVSHLILHGCLHLLGFDHERDGDAALMESLETKALASIGVADPYSLPSSMGLNDERH